MIAVPLIKAMNYAQNEDKLRCYSPFGTIGQPRGSVQGISYTVVQDLDEEPVTVAFAKEHMRIDFATDDNLVESYLKSARQYLEKFSQLSFGSKRIRFRALRVPPRWRLMYGPYSSIATPNSGYTLFGDMLVEGGDNVDIELTTEWPDLPENIRVSICKRAAGEYAFRENVLVNVNGTMQSHQELYDEAERLLLNDRNFTFI